MKPVDWIVLAVVVLLLGFWYMNKNKEAAPAPVAPPKPIPPVPPATVTPRPVPNPGQTTAVNAQNAPTTTARTFGVPAAYQSTGQTQRSDGRALVNYI